MVHAYRLVSPLDPSAPDQLWEWQQPAIHCLQAREAMDIIMLSSFGRHDDLPRVDLDPEWHTLVRQQVLRILQPAQRLRGLWSHGAVQCPRGQCLSLQALWDVTYEVTAWGRLWTALPCLRAWDGH